MKEKKLVYFLFKNDNAMDLIFTKHYASKLNIDLNVHHEDISYTPPEAMSSIKEISRFCYMYPITLRLLAIAVRAVVDVSRF